MAETKTTETDDPKPVDLAAVRKAVEATLDPVWVAKHGDESWKAAMAALGEPPD